MRIVIVLALAGLLGGGAAAQTINGESTEDSAYAPRPPARWHAPDAPPDRIPEPVPLGIDPGPRPDEANRAADGR